MREEESQDVQGEKLGAHGLTGKSRVWLAFFPLLYEAVGWAVSIT